MGRALAFFFGLIVFGLPTTAEAGDKLGRVRSEVRGGGSSPAPSRGRSSAPVRSTSSRSAYGVGYQAPRQTQGSSPRSSTSNRSRSTYEERPRPPPEPPSTSVFGDYPYEYGNKGYVKRVPRGKVDDRRDFLSGTARVEGGYAGDKVWRAGFGLTLQWWRLGLDSDLNWLVDQALTDAMYLGATHATFMLVMRPHLTVRTGPGVSYMVDGRTPGQGRREYAAGFNYLAALDITPVKPLVISGRLEGGKLYKTLLLGVRGSIGFLVRRWELHVGYDFKRIGAVNVAGPYLGVRAWF